MKRVLVLDDDKEILMSMEAVLATDGYQAYCIAKWEEVFVAIDLFKPDLILLDFFLIGNNGGAICKEIKANENLKHIPVLMFSANNQNHTLYHADDFVTKPFEMNDKLSKISNLLNKN